MCVLETSLTRLYLQVLRDIRSLTRLYFQVLRDIRSLTRLYFQVLRDIRSLTRLPNYTPTDPAELCEKLFVTCYMGTENSSNETQSRAAALARDIGTHHISVSRYTLKGTLEHIILA
eukprot:sb/3476530/